MENLISKIQFRQGTAIEWETSNPVLSKGEPAYDTTNGTFKIGDGETPWNDLRTLGTVNIISDVPESGKEYLRILGNWVEKDTALDLKDLLRAEPNIEIDMLYEVDGKKVYGIRYLFTGIDKSGNEDWESSIVGDVSNIIDFGGSFQLGQNEILPLGVSSSLGNSYVYVDKFGILKVFTIATADRSDNFVDVWVLYTKTTNNIEEENTTITE